jgi:hypothetical protein
VRLPFVIVIAVCLLAAGAGWAIAGSRSSNATIRACASRTTGVLRLVRTCKKGERLVTWNSVGPRGLQGAKGEKGETGALGANGTNGTNGTNGPPGTARAYGLVVNGTTVGRSKNITGVTNPFAGTFCISLAAAIDPSATGAVVTPDFTSDDTAFGDNADQAFAEWRSGGLGCPAGTLVVETGVRTVSSAADPQGGAIFVTAVTNTHKNEPFFIVVP